MNSHNNVIICTVIFKRHKNKLGNLTLRSSKLNNIHQMKKNFLFSFWYLVRIMKNYTKRSRSSFFSYTFSVR